MIDDLARGCTGHRLLFAAGKHGTARILRVGDLSLERDATKTARCVPGLLIAIARGAKKRSSNLVVKASIKAATGLNLRLLDAVNTSQRYSACCETHTTYNERHSQTHLITFRVITCGSRYFE